MWLIYKYENETKMQMVKKYKVVETGWISMFTGMLMRMNKGNNGKWGTLSVAVNTQCE